MLFSCLYVARTLRQVPIGSLLNDHYELGKITHQDSGVNENLEGVKVSLVLNVSATAKIQ